MYINVWLYHSVLVEIALGLVVLFSIWKVVQAIVKTIPFLG